MGTFCQTSLRALCLSPSLAGWIQGVGRFEVSYPTAWRWEGTSCLVGTAISNHSQLLCHVVHYEGSGARSELFTDKSSYPYLFRVSASNSESVALLCKLRHPSVNPLATLLNPADPMQNTQALWICHTSCRRQPPPPPKSLKLPKSNSKVISHPKQSDL